jgi:mono/diheme cytochrome c family protein
MFNVSEVVVMFSGNNILKTLVTVCILSIPVMFAGCDRKQASGAATMPSGSSLDSATQASQLVDGNSEYVPDPEVGREIFGQTCATCHGFQAQGLPHQGAALRTSPFVAGKDDKDLIAFIRRGRLAKDPTNRSGAAMPPSGNNPALSDERLADVVAFLRQVQEEAKAEATTGNTGATTSAAK